MENPNEHLLNPLQGETEEQVREDMEEVREMPGAEEPILDSVDRELFDLEREANADDDDDIVARMRTAGGDGTAGALGV